MSRRPSYYLVANGDQGYFIDSNCEGQMYATIGTVARAEPGQSVQTYQLGSQLRILSFDPNASPAPLPLSYTNGYGTAYRDDSGDVCVTVQVNEGEIFYFAIDVANVSGTFAMPVHVE